MARRVVLHQEPSEDAIPYVHQGEAGEEGKLVVGSCPSAEQAGDHRDGASEARAARPSLMGVASSRLVVSTAVAVMAAIPVVTEEAKSEVTLAVPPPPVMEEERRETGLPVSPSGGALGSPA